MYGKTNLGNLEFFSRKVKRKRQSCNASLEWIETRLWKVVDSVKLNRVTFTLSVDMILEKGLQGLNKFHHFL